MEKSEMHQSSIAEEQYPIALPFQRVEVPSKENFKYASVMEIRSLERTSEINNQKLIDNHPTLFNSDTFAASSKFHFLRDEQGSAFIYEGRRQQTDSVLIKKEGRHILNIPVSNVCRNTTLAVTVSRLKRGKSVIIENRQRNQEERAIRFKYAMNLNQGNLMLKVLVQLEGVFKIWKQMEVPLVENRVTFIIQQFNNEQTDITINDYHFHLLLKMPYNHQSNYCISLNQAELQKLQFVSMSEGRGFEDTETHCSKQCQLI